MGGQSVAVVALACFAVLLLALVEYADRPAPAQWRAAAPQAVSRASTSLDALVTQDGCNGGKTNPVRDAFVEVRADRVVVTTTVAGEGLALSGGATCPGNPAVPQQIVLPEPVGDRPVYDGQCLSNLGTREAGGVDCIRVPAPAG